MDIIGSPTQFGLLENNVNTFEVTNRCNLILFFEFSVICRCISIKEILGWGVMSMLQDYLSISVH